uniref:C-Jun-amino-terminal kinase-interacting protein 4 n=1 Tax=Strigamia maritima TaxID=126957 RepID=T1IY26_STRMM
MEMEQETVYGTHEDPHAVMSEKVQSWASSIYQEFERMITKYDQDVVKDLMPLVVTVLESLDISFTQSQEHEVELELQRDDNEQLMTQYEREKQLRKAAEQKCLEMEDAIEEETKEFQSKIESLESIVRMLELKSKNSTDHVTRLEEKEGEMKKEYNKLHDRYTELFKTHMDYIERTKILYGADRMDQLPTATRRNIPVTQMRSGSATVYNVNAVDSPLKVSGSPIEFSSMTSPNRSSDSATSLKSEIQETNVTSSRDQETKLMDTSDVSLKEGGWTSNMNVESIDLVSCTSDLDEVEDISQDLNRPDPPRTVRRPNSLYQELSFQDSDALGDVDEGADITDSGSERADNDPEPSLDGMGKEVENLIQENNELLAMKNALNVVKDDLIAQLDDITSEHEILVQEVHSLKAVKEKMRQRILDLEDELKKIKEEAEKNTKTPKSDDEEDVPMAQRKRFTRVEMARVLMERNQYKERFMELQEAVRWTEMIRASRTDPTLEGKKNRTSVWRFSLFSSSEKPQRKPLPYVNVRYNAPTHHVSPALDTMRRKNLGDRRKGFDFLDSELASEKLQAQRARERREQYKQVRAHVKKDDGRMQAYGWSLPAKTSSLVSKPSNLDVTSTKSNSHVPVPVPVYCRPLMEKQRESFADEKDDKNFEISEIWCATGVNLTGGRTRDGGSIVGASIFYSNSSEKEDKSHEVKSEVEQLNQELKDQERDRIESEELEKSLSSLVWICTSTHSKSKVSVIDANNPADILDAFDVCTSHLLCIASVPGAKENDYSLDYDINLCVRNEYSNESEEVDKSRGDDASGTESKIGSVTFVSCLSEENKSSSSPTPGKGSTEEIGNEPRSNEGESEVEVAQMAHPDNRERRMTNESSDAIKDGISEINRTNEVVYEEMEKMSSVLPTIWLGSQSGNLFVHSAVAQWRLCLHSIKLKDSILSVAHVKGRVLVAMADGTLAVFRRGKDGQWDLNNYHLLDLGRPHHSIRCVAVVHNVIWCGYRNKIHVVDPKTLKLEKSFDAHPRKESQVRQMAWVGDGVWVSIRLDSTLRLYHAHTYQHLQDVDIEPYVSKMLGTGKLGFSFVRITALHISCNRLWMGTGNGVIISVPLSDKDAKQSCSSSMISGGKTPGGVVRVYANPNDKLTPGSFIPYCSMAQAQLSFHGHRDAVKFFVSVPGSGGMSAASNSSRPQSLENNSSLESDEAFNKAKSMLVLSGGEGYIDFRIGDGEDEENEALATREISEKPPHTLSKVERSHLIVWQVSNM